MSVRCGGRDRSVTADRCFDAAQELGVFTVLLAVPIGKVGRLAAPVGKRWHDVIDEHGDENAPPCTFLDLGSYPFGIDGRGGPDHHDAVGLIDGFLDLAVERRARTDLPVPPDRIAFVFQRLNQRLDTNSILGGV